MPDALISATAISPKFYFGSSSVRGALLAELKNNRVPSLMDAIKETTLTWRHQPIFFSKFFFTGGNIKIFIYTLDKPWNWLEGGTTVRYARMHAGFLRKTNPGQLTAGQGGGNPNPMYVSKRRPNRGIEARNWRTMIMRGETSPFLRGVNNAVGKAVLKGQRSP